MAEIIAILVLGLTNVAVLVYHAFYVQENNREKAKMLNAVMSKTPEQFRDLEMTAKIEPIKTDIPRQSDLIPEDELSNDEFEKYVLGNENNG